MRKYQTQRVKLFHILMMVDFYRLRANDLYFNVFYAIITAGTVHYNDKRFNRAKEIAVM